ncbi:lysosomal acid phosphatase-like isoform X2 [Homalodisca vitripennis]|nr:lysosomal acid phosphatase-like isoform X2 [Homalodisca vitripennis]
MLTFPTNPYQPNDTSLWPSGSGELTQIGRMHMYKLGEKVRSMYDGFLDQTYRAEDFKANSLVNSRALESAELFLAGLYPPRGFQVWNKDLLWQPIAVFPTLYDHEDVLNVTGENICPKFRDAQTRSLLEADKLYNSSLTNLMRDIIPNTGIDVEQFKEKFGDTYREHIMMTVWHALKFIADNGLTLPQWARQAYSEPLISLRSKIEAAYLSGSFDQIRLLEGELFREIVDMFRSKANNSPDVRRMYYYSGRDHTILSLLLMLGQQNGRYVDTGSALIYELHRNPSTGNFYVQALYIDGSSPNLAPEDINIQSCGPPCDLYDLLNVTEKYYNITNWDQECILEPAKCCCTM